MQNQPIHSILAALAQALVQRSAVQLAALLHEDFRFAGVAGPSFDKAGYIHQACHVAPLLSSLTIEASGVQRFASFVVADFTLHAVTVDGALRSRGMHGVFAGEAMGWRWTTGLELAEALTPAAEPAPAALANSLFPTPFAAAPPRSPPRAAA